MAFEMVLAPCFLWESPEKFPPLVRRAAVNVGGQVLVLFFFQGKIHPVSEGTMLK